MNFASSKQQVKGDHVANCHMDDYGNPVSKQEHIKPGVPDGLAFVEGREALEVGIMRRVR